MPSFTYKFNSPSYMEVARNSIASACRAEDFVVAPDGGGKNFIIYEKRGKSERGEKVGQLMTLGESQLMLRLDSPTAAHLQAIIRDIARCWLAPEESVAR
jgi:hypothetical protein